MSRRGLCVWQQFSNRSRQASHLLAFATRRYLTSTETKSRQESYKTILENQHLTITESAELTTSHVNAATKFPSAFHPIDEEKGQVDSTSNACQRFPCVQRRPLYHMYHCILKLPL